MSFHTEFKVERREKLRKARLLDYFLMYLLAFILGCCAGTYFAFRVAGESEHRPFTRGREETLHERNERGKADSIIFIVGGGCLACVALTIGLLSDRREELEHEAEIAWREGRRGRERAKHLDRLGPLQ